MNNFGVIELASAKTTSAPGWAYVPDHGPAASGAGASSNRKRARNIPGLTLEGQNARQEKRIRSELDALDRDGGRDNTILLPVKSGRASAKHTPNVRKILQSQKTFANHLDDFKAFQALTEANTTSGAAASRTGGGNNGNNSKRPALNKKDTVSTPSSSAGLQNQVTAEDTPMTDTATPTSTILTPLYDPALAADSQTQLSEEEHIDPLLASRIPDPSSDEELRRLLSHPPLTYEEARGKWDEGVKYPTRTFCEICGYWGRVRCTKCGARVCALECLEAHREECVTRYGI